MQGVCRNYIYVHGSFPGRCCAKEGHNKLVGPAAAPIVLRQTRAGLLQMGNADIQSEPGAIHRRGVESKSVCYESVTTKELLARFRVAKTPTPVPRFLA